MARDLLTGVAPFHRSTPGGRTTSPWSSTGPRACTCIDTDGNRYLDGVSSLWVTVHGHRVPEIDAAVRAQLTGSPTARSSGSPTSPASSWPRRYSATAPAGPLPGLLRRATARRAVEAALKMAFQAAAQRGELRPLYVHVAEGYHGDTLGAVSVGGIDTLPRHLPRRSCWRPAWCPPPASSGPAPRPTAPPRRSPSRRDLLAREGEQVCAVVVEPMVQAAGGHAHPRRGLLRGVRRLCDGSGALMVADEVATGVGRTGRMWAVEHADVTPGPADLRQGRDRRGTSRCPRCSRPSQVYEAFLGRPGLGAAPSSTGTTYTANPLCAAPRPWPTCG